jgi:hypothetical protein
MDKGAVTCNSSRLGLGPNPPTEETMAAPDLQEGLGNNGEPIKQYPEDDYRILR